VLFHLNQRRGFKSNRKTERGREDKEVKETDNMKGAIASLSTRIGSPEFRTLGEFLWKRAQADRAQKRTKENNQPFAPLRARPTAKGARNTYNLYFSRAMYRDEFEALWKTQASRDPALTPELKRRLHGIIFHQRGLLPVKPGRCTLIPNEFRAPLAYPIVQHFRILQELANLELIDVHTLKGRRLTIKERDALFEALIRQGEMKFTAMRNKVLKVGAAFRFNFEDAARADRKELRGDSISAQLCRNECFGEAWFSKPEHEQTALVEFLLEEEEEESAIRRLIEKWNLDEGHCAFSRHGEAPRSLRQPQSGGASRYRADHEK
jgi:CRISPR-associated endonuclease Csn1